MENLNVIGVLYICIQKFFLIKWNQKKKIQTQSPHQNQMTLGLLIHKKHQLHKKYPRPMRFSFIILLCAHLFFISTNRFFFFFFFFFWNRTYGFFLWLSIKMTKQDFHVSCFFFFFKTIQNSHFLKRKLPVLNFSTWLGKKIRFFPSCRK